MNGLDYVILALIGLGALHGSSRGILRIATSFIALIAAAYVAAIYHQAAGAYLARAFSTSTATATALGYVVIFLAIMILVAWGGGKLADLVRAVHMSWADRLGGAAVGAALGAMVAGLIVVLLTAALPADATVIRGSQLAPRVLDVTHDLAGFVPAQIRDAYYYREAQLVTYWKQHKADIPAPRANPGTTP